MGFALCPPRVYSLVEVAEEAAEEIRDFFSTPRGGVEEDESQPVPTSRLPPIIWLSLSLPPPSPPHCARCRGVLTRRGLQEGLRSPGTRRASQHHHRAQKMEHTHPWDDKSDISEDDGVRSTMKQLARHASLASSGGWLKSPIVPNAEYSEQLTTLRNSSQGRGRKASTTNSDQAITARGARSHAHLPEGIQGVPIHPDVYIAPHKLQHAIYEARRQVKLFNDKFLRKEPESPKKGDPLDERALSRMSKYSDMWTRGGKIPPFYKDAERSALDLITKLNGNSSGTVPPAPLHERPKILAQLGTMKAIKGHPVVKDTVLKCCKSKEWQERLKAVECIPFLFYKGDPDAVGVLVGRLLDWHLEVRRASVQVLLDSAANLTVTVMSGRDLAQPEAALAVDRMRQEAADAAERAQTPDKQSVAVLQRVSSNASRRSSLSGLMQSVAALQTIQRVGSNLSRRSSTISRAASTASQRRPVEMPEIKIHVVCRLEDSEEDADTQARTISQPCTRRPKFYGGGEVLRLQANDPEQAKLVIELVAHVNGGGPADERCTFYGDRAGTASDGMSVATGTDTRPSTQEKALNQVFNRASSAASMAQKLQGPLKITGPLPPSTVVLGRAEEKLTDIANQITTSEQWMPLTDGHGKPAGSILMKLALEPAKGIGSSSTMGREMALLVAPALLDADPVMRARALRLYQVCISAGWERERKRRVTREQQVEAIRKRRSDHAQRLALMKERESLMDFNRGLSYEHSTVEENFDEFKRACSTGNNSSAGIEVKISHPGNGHDFEAIETPIISVESEAGVKGNEEDPSEWQIGEEDTDTLSPATRGQWLQEEGEGLGKLQSPYFPGTHAMRIDNRGLIPFGTDDDHDKLHDDLVIFRGSEARTGNIPGERKSEELLFMEEEERQRLGEEYEAEKRLELEDEEESALEHKELDVLLEALLGGLCDPDSNVRWTAVELLRVVLKREDDRGRSSSENSLGKRVLDVAVPLARLSDDEDTRVAAINVLYYAGRSCRSWTAHNTVTHLPEDLHHHNSGAQHGKHSVGSANYHKHEDHHYLHHHDEAEDEDDMEGWTLRDVLEDRLDDRNWMSRRASTLAYSNLADKGDLDAIHNVLPLLSDEVYSVRCAALQAIENIAGSPFLKANEKPTELQLQIVKAIVDRVVTVPTPETDPWLNPELEDNARELDANTRGVTRELSKEEQEQFQTELGARMALLFSLGCMEFSGWQSMKHQTWKHMQEWVQDAWKAVCADKVATQRVVAEKNRALQNKYTQAALANMQMQEDAEDEECRHRIAEIHAKALERAATQAATKMQARWRGIKGRERAQEKKTEIFVRISSDEQEKRDEELRQSRISAVQKLEEYMELRDLMSPGSPGRGRRGGPEVILPYPQEFGFHSHTGRSGSRSRKGSRGNTPTSTALPAVAGASFRLQISTVNDQENDEDSENKEGTILPALARGQQRILEVGSGIASDTDASAEGYTSWDPLGRKRSMSPPKKSKKPTIEEQEQESAKKFFAWEEQEKRRKEQVPLSSSAKRNTPD